MTALQQQPTLDIRKLDDYRGEIHPQDGTGLWYKLGNKFAFAGSAAT